jgi:hypothetical protein
MSIKMIAFLNIAPCSVVEVNRCFRVAHCLHHQGDEGYIFILAAVRTWNLARWVQVVYGNIVEICEYNVLKWTVWWRSVQYQIFVMTNVNSRLFHYQVNRTCQQSGSHFSFVFRSSRAQILALRPTVMAEVFRGYGSVLRKMPGCNCKLGCECYLRYPFKFIIH